MKKGTPKLCILTDALSGPNRLNVEIRKHEIQCLVDSGAAVTVIGNDLLERIKNNKTRCKNTITHATSANGSILSVCNCGEMNVLINNIALKTNFHVMPQVHHQLILARISSKDIMLILTFKRAK